MSNKLKLAMKALFRLNSAAAASGAGIPILDAQGEVIGSDTFERVAAQFALKGKDGQPRLGSSVFIVTKEDDKYRFRLPEDFTAANVANAVGIMVKDGDNHIIIAKDEAPATMNWATSNVSGGTVTCDRGNAFKDHDWKSKTATVVNTLGDNAPAAKFCADYYPSNLAEGDDRYGKGKWGLPAAGDLWMMYQHFHEINYALSLINGTLLSKAAYWSITEYSTTHAWYLSFNYGNFSLSTKSANSYRVRPVSAFY